MGEPLKSYFEGFLSSCRSNNATQSTIRNHRICLYRFILPALGEKLVEHLRLIDVDLLQDEARKHGVSRPRAAVVTLRRLLFYIKKCGVTLPFDINDIEVPSYVGSKPIQALTVEEIERVREALTPDNRCYSKHVTKKIKNDCVQSMYRTRCLFEVMLHTGLRLSEALALNIKDINFETNEMMIENKMDGKWEKVYLYGCTSHIQEYLHTRTDTNEALFVSATGQRLGANTAKSMLKRLKRRLNLEKNLTHHLWRKTFITLLLKHGGDPKKTQKAARHRSLQTTLNHYYALDDDEVKIYHEKIMGKI
jgi:site-specific recombinase XerD